MGLTKDKVELGKLSIPDFLVHGVSIVDIRLHAEPASLHHIDYFPVQKNYVKTRSLGALRAPTSSLRPFGPPWLFEKPNQPQNLKVETLTQGFPKIYHTHGISWIFEEKNK